jgi:methyltransferase (TIGR00027 family)
VSVKQDGILRRFGGVPPHVTLVPMDFDREALGPALASRGHAPTKPTFFIWEAVTQYLSEAGVRSTLDFLAAAAPGSRLAFTYVQNDFIDGRARALVVVMAFADQCSVVSDAAIHAITASLEVV